ncbi:Pentapeptide repeats containing protein [Rickettsiales bacterium Ac37b]|nr:Pentapeptide repeats containing protein [Rickettsiales bacterium Ac37b]
MKIIEYTASFEDLQNYMNTLRSGVKISFNEYLQENSEYKNQEKVSVRANLGNIKFDKDHTIDLTGADLSHTILQGVEFNGKYVLLRQANLTGCNLERSSFTNHIDLTGTNLGNIILKSEIFKKCNLIDAIYDPTQSKVAKIKVTNQQLEQYITLRNNGKEVAQGSLNNYLAHILRHYYPEGTVLIADFSLDNNERILDARFSNTDFSGSIFENCTFKGEIDNIILRDCYFTQTLFQNCTLKSPDLRGTNLSTINNIGSQFTSIMAEGKVQFISPKLSVSGDNKGTINQAVKTGVLSQEINLKTPEHNFTIKSPIFDPNYIKGSTHEEAESIAVYKKYGIEDVENYAIYCRNLLPQDTKEQKLPSFKSFIIKTHKISEKESHFIPDLSNLDLSYMNLSFTNFDSCNFAYTKFNGANLRHISLNNCNLSGTDFSSVKRFFFREDKTYLSDASLKNSDLTAAKLNNVDASGAHFDDSIAINIEAEGINIKGASAHRTNFAGAWLSSIKASKLQAKGINLAYTFSRNSQYNGANLEQSDLSYSDFSGSDFTEAELNCTSLIGTRLREANLTRAKFNNARLKADISYATIYETNLENADLAGLFYEEGQEPYIENTDFSKTISSEEQYTYSNIQSEQLLAKKVKKIYDRYAIGLVLGAIALPIVVIAIANIALPTALAATVIATTAAIAVPLVSVFSAAIAIDRLMHNKLGFSFGLTSTLSDIFGAEKFVKYATKDLEQDIKVKEAELQNHDKELKEQENIEAKIKNKSSSQELHKWQDHFTPEHTKSHSTFKDHN